MKILKYSTTLVLEIILGLLFLFLFSCNDKQDDETRPVARPYATRVTIKLVFDSLQERLDNYGNISQVPIGHSAQSPSFKEISVGCIELLKDSITTYYSGIILTYPIIPIDTVYSCCYQSTIANEQVFYSGIDTSVTPDTFKYIRIHFIYEKVDMKYRWNNSNYTGTLAAFLAGKTHVTSFALNDSSFGYLGDTMRYNGQWYLEVDTPNYGRVLNGVAATVQPNILYNSVPSQIGSCVVTCALNPAVFIEDLDSLGLTISISSNHSLEWIENSDPTYFEPFDGDTIYDVGIRGIRATRN
jgi:hypothetical protein